MACAIFRCGIPGRAKAHAPIWISSPNHMTVIAAFRIRVCRR